MGRFSVISWTSSGCGFFIFVGPFLVLVCSLVWCLIQFNDLFRSFGLFLVTCCCKFWADVRGFYWSPLLATSQPLVCVCVYVVCVCVIEVDTVLTTCSGRLCLVLLLWCLIQFIVLFDTVYCVV